MKEIIINQPSLLSFQQKCGSFFLSLVSWLLWLYFLLPLFTLGGWLLGVKTLSDEIRWFGGYKTLLELLELYFEIIGAIALLWLIWTLLLAWLRAGANKKISQPVSDQDLCAMFLIDRNVLSKAKSERKLTVHFDDQARIISVDGDDGKAFES